MSLRSFVLKGPFVLIPCLVVFAIVFFIGCIQAPTKTSETFHPQYDELVTKTSKPVVVTENTIILDARSSFDYGLFHVANSHWFPWENLAESRESGLLMTDLNKVKQRLGLNGIDLHTPVLIVGNGKFGGGAEGRLAWSLLYYGLYDVQVCSIEVFRKQMTSQPVGPAMNKDASGLKPNTHLEILPSEFSQLLQDPIALADKKIRILDVRSDLEVIEPKEVMHLAWKNFYNSESRPNPKIVADLKQIGINPGDRIILVSPKGTESAAAAYALMALGFSNVQNLTGGWKSLK